MPFLLSAGVLKTGLNFESWGIHGRNRGENKAGSGWQQAHTKLAKETTTTSESRKTVRGVCLSCHDLSSTSTKQVLNYDRVMQLCNWYSKSYIYDVSKVEIGVHWVLYFFRRYGMGGSIWEFRCPFSNFRLFCMEFIQIKCIWKRSISEVHPSRERSTYHFMIISNCFKCDRTTYFKRFGKGNI